MGGLLASPPRLGAAGFFATIPSHPRCRTSANAAKPLGLRRRAGRMSVCLFNNFSSVRRLIFSGSAR
jgi:hypothetical protein